jgi:chemotaxis protein methyltransferase CheR
LPGPVILRLQSLAGERLGLESREGKELLISNRAGRHMRQLGISSPEEYLRRVEDDPSGETARELLDLLTTNHTAFWREPSHFRWFEEYLTGMPAQRAITVWCAAASTGEEPHTLAMVAHEALGAAAPARVRILATDVSTRVLETAEQAIYSRERVSALPEGFASRYFEPGRGQWKNHLRVKPSVREMVHFRWLNLNEPFPRIGPFPVIFCRNVMIYFSNELRSRIVAKLLDTIEPGGYLLVGHAEGLVSIEASADPVQTAVYRKRSAGKALRGGTPR